MIEAIRNIEKALGDGIKKPTRSETPNRVVARKSIVAACAINKNDIFSEQNLTLKRPGTGISPMRWDEVLGKIASRNFITDELIEL
jgi:N,N'-diacetyllegionaminate synthase